MQLKINAIFDVAIAVWIKTLQNLVTVPINPETTASPTVWHTLPPELDNAAPQWGEECPFPIYFF